MPLILCMFFPFIFNPKQFHRILSINIFLTFLLDASAKILLYRFYTFSLKCFRSLAHSNVCPKFNENIPSFENIVAATQKQQYASTIIRLVDCFFCQICKVANQAKQLSCKSPDYIAFLAILIRYLWSWIAKNEGWFFFSIISVSRMEQLVQAQSRSHPYTPSYFRKSCLNRNRKFEEPPPPKKNRECPH